MLVVALAILLLSWVVPDHFPPWLSFHTEVPAFVAVTLALCAYLGPTSRSVKASAPVFFISILILYATLQWVSGSITYSGDVLISSIYLATFALAWLWGYQWATFDNKLHLVEATAVLLVGAGLLTAFQVVAQWLQVEAAMAGWVIDGLRNGRPRGNVGQPNQAATILLMGTVGVAVLRDRARIGSLVMWLTALLLGAAITLTQSRTALLSAVLLSVLFICIARPVKGCSQTRSSVLLWLFLLYCAAWLFPSLNGGVTGTAVGTEQMATVGTRPLIWKQLIIGLFESPWAGWGWLQVPAAQQAGALELAGAEQTNYAHNIALDLFLFIGIPAACVVLGAIGVWCWRRAPRVLASKAASNAFLLLMPFLVHCLLEFPHAYAYFLVVAGLLLGGIDAWTEGPNTKMLVIPKWALAGFISLWVVLLVATGYEYALAEEDFRINRFENRKMGETPADYTPPKLVLLTQLGDMLKAMRLRAKPGMAPEELETLINASKRYSWAALQFRTALSLALNNRPAEATLQMRVIKGLFAADIYDEAKASWLRMQIQQYPELARVELP